MGWGRRMGWRGQEWSRELIEKEGGTEVCKLFGILQLSSKFLMPAQLNTDKGLYCMLLAGIPPPNL